MPRSGGVEPSVEVLTATSGRPKSHLRRRLVTIEPRRSTGTDGRRAVRHTGPPVLAGVPLAAAITMRGRLAGMHGVARRDRDESPRRPPSSYKCCASRPLARARRGSDRVRETRAAGLESAQCVSHVDLPICQGESCWWISDRSRARRTMGPIAPCPGVRCTIGAALQRQCVLCDARLNAYSRRPPPGRKRCSSRRWRARAWRGAQLRTPTKICQGPVVRASACMAPAGSRRRIHGR